MSSATYDQQPLPQVDYQIVSRIWVVDDERTIASSLTAILKMSGFDARFFVNPLEALQAADTEKPDLLISDVVMPQLSGIDLAIRLTERRPHCKVLLFSGQASTFDFGLGSDHVDQPVHICAAVLA